MNWYKQQSVIQKESWNWDKFQKGVGFGAALGLAAWLGLSQLEIQNLKEKYQGDEQAVVQALQEEVVNRGGDPIQIIEESVDNNSTTETEVAPPQQNVAEPPAPVEQEEPERSENNLADEYTDHGMANEGVRTRVYDDTAGIPTVGIGHAMGRTENDDWGPRSIRVFREVLGMGLDEWRAVHSGQQELTRDQVRALYRHDVEEHIRRAQNSFDDFDSFPMYLQIALLDSTFRGDTGRNTTALINNGNWLEATSEYLNRKDYYRAKNRIPNPRTGQIEGGIVPRMERNAAAILLMYMEQNNIPTSQARQLIRENDLPDTMLQYIDDHENTIGYVDIDMNPSGNYQFPQMSYENGVLRAASKRAQSFYRLLPWIINQNS